MTLMEALTAAEECAERPLFPDEIQMVAQLVESGAPIEKVIALFDEVERPPEVDDDGVAVYRYAQAADSEGNVVARRF
jgi:hypothetical protein